ncbi:BTB/POZ domain-containing protein [Rhizophagus clarus]|uniref:BTB/POZ domain-containing protein n=1 Tax=Rhizophagus clarus TaxID=94130 RepID=A0A8H3LNW7_9GLOM|nr:BTB/POZ domain-containing protein [Rhizophagus clarus]
MVDKNLSNSVSFTQDSYDVMIKVGQKTLKVEVNSKNNNNPFRNKEFLSKVLNQNYKEFHVHSSILLDIKSKYFYNALSDIINNNDLKRTEKNMIKIIVLELPDIDPTIFEVILEFLYNGNLDISNFTSQGIVSLLFASSFLDLGKLLSHLFTHHFNKIIHTLNTSFSAIDQFETIYSQKIEQRRYIINHLCLEYSSIIFNSNYYLSFHKNFIYDILLSDDLIMNELEIWTKLIKWGIFNSDISQKYSLLSTSNIVLSELIKDFSEKDFTKIGEKIKDLIPLIRFYQIKLEDYFKEIGYPFKSILPEGLNKCIFKYNMKKEIYLNNNNILPPRKYQKIDSAIIIGEQTALLAKWIKECNFGEHLKVEDYFDFKLLLRGSKNGFDIGTFHKRCDGIDNTIVIIKIKGSGEIIGGYNPFSWQSLFIIGLQSFPYENYNVPCSSSFLFSLNNTRLENGAKNILSKIKENRFSEAIYYNQISGPKFDKSFFEVEDYESENLSIDFTREYSGTRVLRGYLDSTRDFSNLLKNTNDYNVKIIVGKERNIKEFKAHSVILSSRSIYFQKALSAQWARSEDGIIIFHKPNISPLVFEVLLNYIYTGVLSIENINISFVDTFIASDELELIEICQRIEERLLKDESCLLKCDDLELEEIELWEYLIKWGIENTDSILDDDSTKWTPMDFAELEKTLHNCIPHIRFFQMSPNDFGVVRAQFKEILPDDLIDDIFQYYLNPKSKLKYQVLPLRESAYNFNSNIINAKDAAIIASWVDKKEETYYHFKDIPFNFELIYRASTEGFRNFHRNCDNRGPTVVVIKVRNSGEIIGGYNPLDWRSVKLEENSPLLSHNNEIYNDHKCEISSSFIFSLANRAIPTLSRVSSKKEAIIWCGDKGPCFGLQDLWIKNGSLPHIIVGKSKQHSYEKKIINRETFEIEEYEVFRIIDNRFYLSKFIYRIFEVIIRTIRSIDKRVYNFLFIILIVTSLIFLILQLDAGLIILIGFFPNSRWCLKSGEYSIS